LLESAGRTGTRQDGLASIILNIDLCKTAISRRSKIIEAFEHIMVLRKEEINRKLLHVLSGTLIPAGILYLPMIDGCSALTPAVILGVLAGASILLEYLRFNNAAVQRLFTRLGTGMLRSCENHSLTGSTYIFISAFICSVVFFNHPHISCIALSLFILGDAVAAIVGISMGRIKIGKKSLEGSAACFTLGLLLFIFVYPRVPLLLDRWNGMAPLPLIVIASFTNTLFELFPISLGKKIPINDNLSVPLLTGMVMLFLYPFVA
jgi:dolichol kinase